MRRLLVLLSLVFMVVLALAANDTWVFYATPEEYYKATGKKITEYHESPMLTKLVEEGKLPPVEQRLPEEPLVVQPVEKVGQFGGTWRRVWKGPSDRWGISKLIEVKLAFWDKEGGKLVPGLAKSWEVLENGRVYIFHLRKGVKWSDGVPYTAHDIVFWVNDIVGNDDITPSKPDWYNIGVKVEALDDYTVKFEFSKPYGLFLLKVPYGGFTGAPAHYLKQFHPKYTPMEEIEKKMVEGVHNTWVDLFNDKNDFLENTELPTLSPWKPITDPTEQFYILERNPYFWAVDIEGNQLPYIDYVRHEYVKNDEVILLKAISGEIDMQWRHIGGLGAGAGNFTLLMENAQSGGYRVLKWIAANGSASRISLNYAHSDEVLRKVFNDVRFRQALSLAINREEINEILFNGLAEPRQASLVSGSPYFDPEWEKAYAEYDPDRANKLLDEMGLKWDDKHEYRLLPDGRPLRFTITVTGQFHVDVWTMVKEYWRQIGVWVEIENVERSLFYVRADAGDFDAMVWNMDRAAQPLSSPMVIFPGSEDIADFWYIGWSDWISYYIDKNIRGVEPEEVPEGPEPPEVVYRLVDLYYQIASTPDPDKIKELMAEATKIHRENLWMIGTVGEDLSPAIAKNNFRNVPEFLVTDDVLRTPLNAMPMQFFIEQK
ncbi:extracellular solute-binding protein family 5 [Thermotoga petrophila RKU-10]|uniref:Extracellular solute-binding protein family 5 n=1 Tax=Thermotoga petrophila (strain ATCC BAA-489 / DSM 13996 / JCM 10882 / RKU-10) TaxID=590168 RepID=D2C745_THEP2|nr:ABC transporter substrate-binding protein [Thermotoga petrophila]ADA66781.1 extracellular solute-binding protein family 5 [Thermotoga petrophila RKU-10]